VIALTPSEIKKGIVSNWWIWIRKSRHWDSDRATGRTDVGRHNSRAVGVVAPRYNTEDFS